MDLPKIYGFNKTSEMGEEVFSVSIFLKGCNLRCPYCMNSALVTGIGLQEVDIQEVKKYVKENKSEWVNISGGEPTETNLLELINLILEIKSWGCKVGMATNGVNVSKLVAVLNKLDYVALDIKAASCNDYNLLLKRGYNTPYIDVMVSKSLLENEKAKRDGFDYEIRTTLYPKLIDVKSLNEIGMLVGKDVKWVLQQFRNTGFAYTYDVEPYDRSEINKLLNIANKYSDRVILRYV